MTTVEVRDVQGNVLEERELPDELFGVPVNRKMKRAALRSALSDAAQTGKLAVVSGLSFDGPRTKDAVGVLDALGLEGRVLMVLAGPDEAVEKSFRNLPNVKV